MPITVATAQFVSTSDVDTNLATMLELLDEAAAAGARLVHFAEFTNHPTWYANQDHAWQAAITVPGPMFDAIAASARRHALYVSFNATVRSSYPSVFDQNNLVGPDGRLLVANRKQILMSSERDYYEPGHDEAVVADTALGRIGLMSCMDGLIPETARVLAVRGAQLILNSLSSNGLDEAHTHIPARAAENGVYVLSANRVGPLVDEANMALLAERAGMSPDKLVGAGESELVGPDGSVIARATREPVARLLFATVDLDTDERAERLARRRPECYGLLTTPNGEAPFECSPAPPPGRARLAAVVPGGTAGPGTSEGGPGGLQAAREAIERSDADLVVLPELALWRRQEVAADPRRAAAQAEELIAALGDAAAATGRHVVSGLPLPDGRGGLCNGAVLVGPAGVLARYAQVHVHPEDDGWARAGDELVTVDLPFGRLGLLVGFDLLFPEAARVLARRGADAIACPMTWRRRYEHRLLAPERSAENHVALVVSARPDSPERAGSLICSLPAEYRFPVTGEVNMPEVAVAKPGEPLAVTTDLATSRDKRLMRRTDLLRHAQPALYGALTTAGGSR